MIEVHLLRYVLAAADTGSFSRAAEQFGIKQSTLSKRVQFLELRLGLPLFRRSTRGVVPTDPGQRFLGKARRIVQDIDALGRESRALAKGDAGTLRLGFHGSLAVGDLAAVTRAFRLSQPDVEIEARECGRSKLLDALERDQLDLAICTGQSSRPTLSALSFWSEPVLIGLAAGHPLTARDRLYWTDLRGACFVVTAGDPGPDLADLIVARLSGPGQRPSILSQDVSRENLAAFASGERVIASAGIVPTASANGEIVLREVHDAFGATLLEQSVHWRRDDDSPVVRRFLEMLADRYARPLPRH